MTDNVIFSYSDREACEDGVLVKIGNRDRISRAAWDFLTGATPLKAEPPKNWPVEMLNWFKSNGLENEMQIRDRKALALAKGIIAKEGREARRVWENNIDGGVYWFWAQLNAETISAFSRDAVMPLTGARKLWMIPNELGGVTLLFPEDY
jgi:hypothetical protein